MAAPMSSKISCLGGVAFRNSMHRALLPTKGANYHTASQAVQRVAGASARPSVSYETSQNNSLLSRVVVARAASTSANSSISSTTNTSQSAPSTLTWNDFLKLRRTRRYVNLGASIFSGIGSIAVATPLIAEYEIETIGAQMTGLDPMFVIGGSLMAVGGVGWLMGPFLGTAIFKIWKSSAATEFARKEKSFYGHIKRYRADPASSSVNNPVPDYYGEKIGSVADYRRWLKDQRAFNRKKNKNMI